MIIINSSVPKSGSTALVWLLQELVKKSGRRNAQEVIVKKNGNPYFRRMTVGLFLWFTWVHFTSGSFVIKMHRPPDTYSKMLVRLGLAKVVCSYRDPRDIVLSALDHGERNRQASSTSRVFTKFTDIDSALFDVTMWLKFHQGWKEFNKGVLFVRYEDFMEDKEKTVVQMDQFLKLGVSGQVMEDILEKYEQRKAQMHNYNKGKTNRYMEEMTEEERKQCEEVFQDYLVENSYPLTSKI
jgi:hypothetical protein